LREKFIKDNLIIQKIISGSSDEISKSLEYLYKVNFPVILRFIQNNNGSEPEAADIFQDSLIIFYEKAKSGKLQLTCSIGTYLYSISRNLWLKRLKKMNYASVRIEDIQDFLAIPNENSLHENEKLVILINEIFDKLSEKCRKVLISFYYDNLSMSEIKKVTGYKSVQTVKNKKYKCMKELIKIIDSSKSIKETLRNFLTDLK
jgi:RNA polymerase sigma factor (sigma-70 family)